ncbi:hypothetical protein CBER1_02236 [Cercospora berteroae]|uniref:Uncharacterized protein n=1 Tax=Cercospora berteroae TaxID=357750 RepID=A0A2S6CAW7_9PEZI|nr:hypothetical protein CBER1_02236 [Cercospora berteroae]
MSSRNSVVDPKTALLTAYIHNANVEGDITTQITEEMVQIGEASFENWYEELETWLESHSGEKRAPQMKLVAAWAATKCAGQAGDEGAVKMADSIWDTGDRLSPGWKDSVVAWCKANPGLAPADA